MAHQITPEMRECIQNCLNCHAICLETANHCLMIGGKHASAEHQRILHDSAQICETCADFMLRTSDHQGRICGGCAEVCRACAEDCERLADTDELMRRCADVCRRCQQSCERMAHAIA